MNNNDNNFRSKPKGIHHANIKDKDKAVKRLKSSFRKASIKITLENEKTELIGQAILSEIHPKSAYLFFDQSLKKGTTLIVHLKEPLAIDVRGRVRYCESASRNAGTKTASEGNFRVLIEFLISSDLERDAMLDYYQQVRDENYVATKWHHYISEKAQQEAKARMQQRKMAEQVEEVKQQPILASDDMLVQATTDAVKKNTENDDKSGGGQQSAA